MTYDETKITLHTNSFFCYECGSPHNKLKVLIKSLAIHISLFPVIEDLKNTT